MRIDKFVWCVRLAKTRSLAAESITKSRVKLNGVAIKPSKEVRINDVIQLYKNGARFDFKIIALTDKRLGAKLVADYIEDRTDPQEVEKFKQYQLAQQGYREYGTGKPSKKDRRDLDEFLSDW